MWKKEGLCLNELDAAVLSRWKPPGCTPQISLDLALEQCRARARSQPHMLEPTATAGGDGGLGEGVCVAGPLPGQPLHTQRRPWGAAPGCFETGAGLITARFCNGCSRFDWKARRGVGPWKLGQRGAPLGGSCRRSPEPTVRAESLSPCSPPPGDMDAKLLGGRRDNRDCQRPRHPKSDGGQSLEPYYNR